MTVTAHRFTREVASAGKQLVKRLVFPGVDVHARSRYRLLPRFFTSGGVRTLDAGCGNGMLAYAAYRLGNEVLAVTCDRDEVRRNRQYYAALGVDPDRLVFRTMNVYDLDGLGPFRFDQVICAETLEHVRDDQAVIRHLAAVLRPGGVLHLCCPNALHPLNALGRTDEPEDGGHVRDGYTVESYRKLLEPEGFRIDAFHGIGSRSVVRADRLVRTTRNRLGNAAAIPVLLAVSPVRFADRLDPPVPFSLYVRATWAPDHIRNASR